MTRPKNTIRDLKNVRKFLKDKKLTKLIKELQLKNLIKLSSEGRLKVLVQENIKHKESKYFTDPKFHTVFILPKEDNKESKDVLNNIN